jgi:HSP20 family protein
MASLLPSLWNPSEAIFPLSRMRRAIDQIFEKTLEDEFPALTKFGNGNGEAFLPAVDVKDTDDAILVETEVPGMEAKDITVQVEGDVLTIKGERKREEEKKTRTYYRKECSYGAFERQIPLPIAVVADKVDATVTKGMLKVTLPKEPGAKAKAVTVKVR